MNRRKSKVAVDVAMEIMQCPDATLRVVDADGVEYFLTGLTLEETTAFGSHQRAWTLKMESVPEQREAAIGKIAQAQWAREKAEREARREKPAEETLFDFLHAVRAGQESGQEAWLKETNRLANLAFDKATERQEEAGS